jgi:hypothetical protein
MGSSINFVPDALPASGANAPQINFVPDAALAAAPSPTPQPDAQGNYPITFAKDAEGQGYGNSTPPPQPSLGRSIGLTMRSWGPVGAAAGGGALASSMLLGPETAPLGAGAGLLSYGGAKMIGDPLVAGYNYIKPQSWPALTPPTQAISNALDTILPKPSTPDERITDAVNQAVADSVGTTGLGAFKGAAGALQAMNNPVVQGVGKAIAEGPVAQAGLSALSGAGYGITREAAPDNRYAQMAGALLPALVAGGVANAGRAGLNYLGADNVGAFITGGRDAAANVYGQNAVAKLLQERAGTPFQQSEAVDNLNQAINNITANGYQPTAGTASGNVGLIATEKGLVNNPTVLNRYVENQRAVNNALADQMQKSDVSPSAAQNFMGNILEGQQRSAQNSVNAAQDAAARAEQALAQRQADVSTMSADSTRTGASTQIRGSLNDQFNNARATADALYSKIPQDVVVPVNDAHDVAAGIAKSYEGTVGEVPPAITKFLEVSKDGAMPAAKAQRNLEELYAAIQETPKNSPAAKALGDLRDALDHSISQVEPVSKPLQEARNYYRNTLAPQFKQGASAPVLNQRGAGGADAVAPGNTLDRYMGNEADAARLKSALSGEGGELKPSDAAAVRDWAVSKMAASVGENPTGTKIRSWLKANDSVISQFPEIKTEIQKMANRIGGAAQFKDKMAGELVARQADLKAAQTAATDSNVAKFANGNPVAEVDSFLYGNNADRRMAELVKQANLDKTGQATEGLKNAVKESILQKVKAFGSNPSASNSIDTISAGDLPATIAKMNKLLLDGTPTRRAMQQVFTPDEMGKLDQIRKQLEVSNRINWKATTGSDTSALSTAQEMVGAVKRGAWNVPIVKGAKTIGSILDVGGAALRAVVMKDPEKAAKDILTNAMLDPKLAKALLLKPTDTNLPMIQQSIMPYLTPYLQNPPSQQTAPGKAGKMLNAAGMNQ